MRIKKYIASFSIYLLICSIVFCIPQRSYTQQKYASEKITSFCKVWGFLKYYHPAVANGNMDWDSIFVSKMDTVLSLNTNEDVNRFYINWVNSLGDVTKYPSHSLTYDTTCTFSHPLSWINDPTQFSDTLQKLLYAIAIHRNYGYNRFVQFQKRNGAAKFTNEPTYKLFDIKDKAKIVPPIEYRLLSLARYWNMIEYYFPNKYLTDEPWDSVLTEMIPRFYYSDNYHKYNLAVHELVAKTDDSHAQLFYPSKYFIPAITKIIDDKAIITQFYNDSLANIDGLQIGDIIISEDGKSIPELIKSHSKYIGLSNSSYLAFFFGFFTIAQDTPIANVTFERNGKIFSKSIQLFQSDKFKFFPRTEKPKLAWKFINNDIGYIDLEIATNKQIRNAIKDFKNTKGIVLDLRTYPRWTLYTLCNLLSKDRTEFVKMSRPDYNYPGTFIWEKPLYCGKKREYNPNRKIVILIDEQTISQAEFTAMALKTLPSSVLIGSQTAGADGNVSTIELIGGYKFYMTGLGAYYPDGKATQRIGIIPDIHIKPTLNDVLQHKDVVLNRAIQYIETGS